MRKNNRIVVRIRKLKQVDNKKDKSSGENEGSGNVGKSVIKRERGKNG